MDVKHCPGYLGHEFLSAVDRDGKIGGSFENRTRGQLEALGIKLVNITAGSPYYVPHMQRPCGTVERSKTKMIRHCDEAISSPIRGLLTALARGASIERKNTARAMK